MMVAMPMAAGPKARLRADPRAFQIIVQVRSNSYWLGGMAFIPWFICPTLSGKVEGIEAGLKITAANMLAPYLSNRKGLLPPPTYTPEPYEGYIKPTSAAEAADRLAQLSADITAGIIDLETANAIGDKLKLYIASLTADFETRLIAIEAQLNARGS